MVIKQINKISKFRKIIFSFFLVAASFGVTSSFAIPAIEEAKKQLLKAAANDDLDAIERLIVLNPIRSESSPKILDGKNNPRLVAMSESGICNSLQQNINDLYVSKFLEFINTTTYGDKTALIWAAKKGHIEIVELLINKAKEVFKNNPKMFFEFIRLHA